MHSWQKFGLFSLNNNFIFFLLLSFNKSVKILWIKAKYTDTERLDNEHLAIVNNLSMTINLLLNIEQPGNSKKLTKKFIITKFDCTSKCRQLMNCFVLA